MKGETKSANFWQGKLRPSRKTGKPLSVVPLYKQRGDASAPTNYRPMSFLPAVAKVLDAIQSKRLSSFLVKNKLLTDHQFGFPPRTVNHTTACLSVCSRQVLVASNTRQRSASVGVFLNFQKAQSMAQKTAFQTCLLRCLI